MNNKSVLGYEFISEPDITKVVDAIFNQPQNGKNPVVATLNVDQIVKFNELNELKAFIQQSYMILPDGQPIVWASSILGKPLARRITGSDLFPLVWEKALRLNSNILCITPSDKVADLLSDSNPNCVCYTPPFFSATDSTAVNAIVADVCNLIKANSIEYVVVGISLPKREILAKQIISQEISQMPTFLLFGAAFEFYLGTKKRAPIFFQKHGLEWLHRFSQEPTRLFKRYFIESLPFFIIVVKSIRENR